MQCPNQLVKYYSYKLDISITPGHVLFYVICIICLNIENIIGSFAIIYIW